jgi:DNA replication and repair protein RecF
LWLWDGARARGRAFLDTALAVAHPDYADALTGYEQTLKRRNKLLTSVQEGQMPRSVLGFWNVQLVKYGEILQRYRRSFLETFSEVSFPVLLSVEYLPSVISTERIDDHVEREIIVGHTLIGPHKDDLGVHAKTAHSSDLKSLATYGSRGQQRMGVLWLKMCEYHYLKNKTQQAPLLLLDDILSELDEDARQNVTSLFGQHQVIITTTDLSSVTQALGTTADTQILELSDADARK